jgi:hypothetical protein
MADEVTITQDIFVIGHPAWVENLMDAIQTDQRYGERDILLLAEHAREAKASEVWNYTFEDEPKTWARFCRERLDMPAEYIDAIVRGVEALEAHRKGTGQ